MTLWVLLKLKVAVVNYIFKQDDFFVLGALTTELSGDWSPELDSNQRPPAPNAMTKLLRKSSFIL